MLQENVVHACPVMFLLGTFLEPYCGPSTGIEVRLGAAAPLLKYCSDFSAPDFMPCRGVILY